MNSQLIRCTTCGKELIVDEEISSLVCGYCFEAVDLNEARAVSRRKEPPEFLVKNGVLERYFGERSYDIRTPPGVKKIGPVAFSEGVCGVTVSEGVEVIETRAFEACWYLEYLELPNSLKKIEKVTNIPGRRFLWAK